MKQILVLQNQRIGDTLQTTPLLVGLREKHRPCRITLVTNNLFADLNLRGLVDEVVSFDQNGLFEALNDERTSIVNKFDHVREFVETFRRNRFDLVIDVPADRNMHLLASALRSVVEIRGVTLSPTRGWRYSHEEVMLLYTVGLCREVNRFNLVDLQNLLAAVQPLEKKLHLPLRPEAEQSARRLLVEEGVDPEGSFIVALQAGASEERKRWGDTNFARLARILVQRLGARVLLCGSPAEADSGRRIAAEAGVPLVPAVGRTSVAELAALIRHCAALVTNDTGTMHVAAAVGTPVVDVSTGPVNFRETGPYAAGSFVVEGDIACSPCNFNALCHHYGCREMITPEMIFSLVATIRSGEDPSRLPARDFRGAKVHRAVFNDVGRLEFYPLFRYPVSLFQFLSFFYAHTWEVFYKLRAQPRAVSEVIAEIGRWHDLDASSKDLRQQVPGAVEELRHVESELKRGEKILRPLLGTCHPTNGGGDSIEAISEFQSLYKQLTSYGCTRPAVRHFTAFLELAVESQGGSEPAAAIARICDSLRFLRRQVEFLAGQLEESVVALSVA